jgi:hypothetical protein
MARWRLSANECLSRAMFITRKARRAEARRSPDCLAVANDARGWGALSA